MTWIDTGARGSESAPRVRDTLLDAAFVASSAVLGVFLASRFGWFRTASAAILLTAAAVLASRPPLLIAGFAFLAAFDGYIQPFVIYRNFLFVDVFGFALIAALVRAPAGSLRLDLRLALALLGLLAMIQIASLSPGNWGTAADNVVRFAYFVLLFAAIAIHASDDSLPLIVAGLVAGLVLRFGYEAALFFSHPAFALQPSFQFGTMTSNPNTLAGVGACVLPASCALALLGRSRWERLLGASAGAVLATGIVISFSKSAWLATSAGLIVLAWYSIRTNSVRWRSAVAASLFLALLGSAVPAVRAVPGLMKERWLSRGSALSNQERLRYAQYALRLMQEHPLRGAGLTEFGPRYKASRRQRLGPEDPHNAYLSVGSELGVPALAVFVGFLSLVLIGGAERARASGLMRGSLVAAAAALLTFQMFSAEPPTTRVFWLIAGLSLSERFIRGQSSRSPADAHLLSADRY